MFNICGNCQALHLSRMAKCSFLILLFIAACSNQPEVKKIHRPKQSTITLIPQSVYTTPPFTFNYPQLKERCQQLYSAYKQLLVSEKKLITFITDSLVPCWYGTPWDFNGTTEVPGKGKIACGYFVTTTLRDAGMKINRVKMAQCVSQNLLYDLCRDFKKFSDTPLPDFVAAIKKSGYGLYIVGLDNHTGYLYNDGEEVWFIHSGVYAPRCALKEKAISSVTLNNSRYRVYGRIVF